MQDPTITHVDVNDVVFKDGHKENVRIFVLELEQYPDALKLIDEMLKFVPFCARKQTGWINTVSGSSFTALRSASLSANDDFLDYVAQKLSMGKLLDQKAAAMVKG